MHRKDILVIKTGKSTKDKVVENHGDYDEWIMRAAQLPLDKTSVVCVSDGEQLPTSFDFQQIIITGSYHMITEELDWMKQSADWLLIAMNHFQ